MSVLRAHRCPARSRDRAHWTVAPHRAARRGERGRAPTRAGALAGL